MRLAIYPPIGIARVGNALERFFIGPELPGAAPLELDQQGSATPLQQFKVDKDELKRQAARFRLMAFEDDGTVHEFQPPAGATVEWTVQLVNKKAAVKRVSSPPSQPNKPQLVPNPVGLVIDPGARSVSGPNASPAKFDTGEFMGRRVPLGDIRTDRDQRLLVLGGFGFSSSPTNKPLPSFYTNPGWHDDVSDGPVTAKVRLADGTVVNNITPAWVLVATPDFAPEIQGIVTLYDVMLQVGIDQHSVNPPGAISFTEHVFPMLDRARKLQWVHVDSNWTQISDDWASHANAFAQAQASREAIAQVVRESESILNSFRLTALQNEILDRWAAGDFQSDWNGTPPVPPISPADLTRAPLEAAVGQGFFPGIEAGILVRIPAIYSTPFDFRLDHQQMTPGDLSALMAVPWQADFEDCEGSWWPSQRPDDVRIAPNDPLPRDWSRGVNGRIGMVNNFSKLAYITPQSDSAGQIVFAESQRAEPEDFT